MIHYDRDDVKWSAEVRDMTFGDMKRARAMSEREEIEFLVLEVRRDNEVVDSWDEVPYSVLFNAAAEAYKAAKGPLVPIGAASEKNGPDLNS